MGLFRRRHDVRVFVDDYVLGRLPDVCVLTGEPADGTVTNQTRVGNPNPLLLLLVLLGPIGWIILALAAGRSGRELAGELPITRARWHYLQSVRRTMWATLAAFVVGFVATLLSGADDLRTAMTAVVAVVAFCAAAGIKIWLQFQWPTVRLDASGRWVTLQAVSPEFARAVAERNRRARDTTPTNVF
jgi:hypothetical protein